MITDPFRHLGIYSRRGFLEAFSGSLIKAPFPATGSEQRNLLLSVLSRIQIHFPMFLSSSQFSTSLNMLALGSWRLGIFSCSAISRKLCSNRASLLAWIQKTYVFSDADRIWYEYSMVRCDFFSLVSYRPRNGPLHTYPTLPRPTRAILDLRIELFSWIDWSRALR
jgi:hypothetical protein